MMTNESMSDFPLRLEGDNVPMVSFRKVTKSYGSLVVLDALDLDVAEGNTEYLAGKIQERYGMARDEAKKAVREFEDSL